MLCENLRGKITALNFHKTRRVKAAWNAVVRDGQGKGTVIPEVGDDLSQKFSARKKKATNSSRVVADEEVQCPSE
jgi:hypothetical protein